MTKPISLSTTARTVLTTAAERDDRLALAPERLPAAARRAVVHSMLKAGLIEEVAAADGQPAWRTAESGERFALRITDAGLSAVRADQTDTAPHTAENGSKAETPDPAQNATTPPAPAQKAPLALQRADARLTLRAAAQAVLAAWYEEGRPA